MTLLRLAWANRSTIVFILAFALLMAWTATDGQHSQAEMHEEVQW